MQASTTSSILIPLDGSKFAEEVLDRGLELYPPTSTTVTLLHCMEDREILYYTSRLPPKMVEQVLESERLHHQQYIEAQVERLRRRGYSCQGVLSKGDPVEKILATAQERGCAQIVLTTHGRRGLSRVFMGSVAEGVLRRSQLPVLVVPCAKDSE